MDARAAADGVEAIGPLYGLPVPMKGTMATTDYPSSAGNAAMDTAKGTRDAAFTALFRNANALAFGKTNVPDFAASWVGASAYSLWCYTDCMVMVCAVVRVHLCKGVRACVYPQKPPLLEHVVCLSHLSSGKIPAMPCHAHAHDRPS